METILIILIAYFGISYFYTFFMIMISSFNKENKNQITNNNFKYSIVIPAYKEDRVIIETAYSAIQQKYNKELFDVYVLADQLKETTIKLLAEIGANVIKVSFEKSTKVKSLKKYAELYGKNSDYTIILDADNCIDTTFLKDINNKININNSDVIQVLRKSKNHNTSISFLDAFSEYANTIILCKGPNTLKLSSKLSGSGMILKSNIFNDLIQNMNGISGFDKEMELKLTQSKVFIEYYDNPFVYDEKLVNHTQIKTQRGRWIYAQFDYLRKFFISGITSIFKGNLDHTHKVLQLALPPRVLGILALIIVNAASIIFSNNIKLINSLLIVDSLFIISYLFLFIKFIQNHKIPKGLMIEIIKVIIGYILAIKYFKRAGKEFLHTKHNI